MQKNVLLVRSALLAVLGATSLLMLGCGLSNGGSKNSGATTNTYMYVAEGEADAYVAQLQVGNDGTLSSLSPATVGGPGFPGTNFVTVDPSGQYLFTGNALLGGTTAVGQYVIGSDGTLAPNAIPAVNVTGWNQLTFTPNGKFTFVPDFQDGVIDSYSLSASGSLAQVNQLSVDSIPANVQPTAIDPSGRFLYFFECTCTNSSSYSLMEYGISADGALTPLSPNYVVAPGYTYSLTVGPNGFLYFPDIDHGTVTVFQIDESAGQLANAGRAGERAAVNCLQSQRDLRLRCQHRRQFGDPVYGEPEHRCPEHERAGRPYRTRTRMGRCRPIGVVCFRDQQPRRHDFAVRHQQQRKTHSEWNVLAGRADRAGSNDLCAALDGSRSSKAR